MKWFKHMTDARRNKHVQAIRGRWGIAGCMRYFWVLEIIAEQMDESDACEVTYRPGFWTRELGFRSANDCRSFLEWLANDRGMISVQLANEWTVRCDKLLKTRARKKPIGNKKCTLDIEVDSRSRRRVNTTAPSSTKVDLDAEGNWLNLTEEKLRKWGAAYPAVAIQSELSRASAWLIANPKNKKKNYERFLVNWFARAQEKAPRVVSITPSGPRKFALEDIDASDQH